MVMKRKNCQLLVVDIQDRFMPAMSDVDNLVRNCKTLMKAADILKLPISITEQYPQGLGHTIPEIKNQALECDVFAKVHFSCSADDVILAHLGQHNRNQVVICGIEAHVCVLQTALGLKENGFDVFVVADAITSRKPDSVRQAIERLRDNGISLVNTEMAIFEWLEVAGSDEFRQVSKLIR